jgi:hypothetical protein
MPMLAIHTVGMFGFIFGAVGLLIAALIFVFWLWMLIHAITNKGLNGTEKIVWVLVIIFLYGLGALIYFFVGRPKGGG